MTAQPYDPKVDPAADPDSENPGPDTHVTDDPIRTTPDDPEDPSVEIPD